MSPSTTGRRPAAEVAGAVLDPELPVLSLQDLGVLRDVSVDGDRVVVTITPTYSGCPAVPEMRADLVRALHRAGYPAVEVRTELSPAWSSDDITARGRARLAAAGIAPPGAVPGDAPHGPVALTLRTSRPVPCPRCGSSDTVETSRFGPTACTSLHRCASCAEPFEHVKEI